MLKNSVNSAYFNTKIYYLTSKFLNPALNLHLEMAQICMQLLSYFSSTHTVIYESGSKCENKFVYTSVIYERQNQSQGNAPSKINFPFSCLLDVFAIFLLDLRKLLYRFYANTYLQFHITVEYHLRLAIKTVSS